MKGYFYTMEAMIAISLIMISIVIIFSSSQTPPSAESALIKRQGMEALEYLDQTGELRGLAVSGNNLLLKTRLSEMLPGTVSFDADICTTTCAGQIPENRQVISIEYFISGYNGIYSAKKIKLWLWGTF